MRQSSKGRGAGDAPPAVQKPAHPKQPIRCRWVVTFEIADTWVANGVKLSQACVDEMIRARVPWAAEGELSASITKEPDETDLECARLRHKKEWRIADVRLASGNDKRQER